MEHLLPGEALLADVDNVMLNKDPPVGVLRVTSARVLWAPRFDPLPKVRCIL